VIALLNLQAPREFTNTTTTTTTTTTVLTLTSINCWRTRQIKCDRPGLCTHPHSSASSRRLLALALGLHTPLGAPLTRLLSRNYRARQAAAAAKAQVARQGNVTDGRTWRALGIGLHGSVGGKSEKTSNENDNRVT
jgi:hypothetical protein